VNEFGFPDQPMLDEMTDAALAILAKNPAGFVLMVECASIDKQAHNMDTDRWILETIEFDRAVARAKAFAAANPDTLVLVTADHECAGVNIIGASTQTDAALQTKIATATADANTAVTAGVNAANVLAALRGSTGGATDVVGTYDNAKFPVYTLAADGYPVSTDVDNRLLIGYAANADRYEDWRTNAQPLKDSQQPLNGVAPLSTYPSGPTTRDSASKFYITGQVGGSTAVHTASDVPLTASGRGAYLFKGVLDNTDVFFLAMQAVVGGVTQ
jgi:alkaline phosphatase